VVYILNYLLFLLRVVFHTHILTCFPQTNHNTKQAISIFERQKRQQLITELKTLIKYNTTSKSNNKGSKNDDSDSYDKYIIDFFGAYYEQGITYLALEYMDKGSLMDMIHREGALNEPFLAHVSASVLRALVYLHSCNKVRIHTNCVISNVWFGFCYAIFFLMCVCERERVNLCALLFVLCVSMREVEFLFVLTCCLINSLSTLSLSLSCRFIAISNRTIFC